MTDILDEDHEAITDESGEAISDEGPGESVVVFADCHILTLTEYAASINAAINVLATTDSLSLVEHAATVQLNQRGYSEGLLLGVYS